MRVGIMAMVILFVVACGRHSEEAIAADVCECTVNLTQVNDSIRQAMKENDQEKTIELFKKAEQEYQKSKQCILSLSNIYGSLKKGEFQRISDLLKKQCPPSKKIFEESGWYEE